MLSKPNRFLSALLIGLSFFIAQTEGCWGSCGPTIGCEEIRPKKKIFTSQIQPAHVQARIHEFMGFPHSLPERKARGEAGEAFAREIIEQQPCLEGISTVPVKSIRTIFREIGCDIDWYLKDGFDDIFLATTTPGVIDLSHFPIFHEAKYEQDGIIVLRPTVTMCQQLSFVWLERQIDLLEVKTQDCRACSIVQNPVFTDMALRKKCEECQKELRKIVRWLQSKKADGQFFRTASVLSKKGKLKVYEVEESGVLYPATLSKAPPHKQKSWLGFGWW